MPPYEYGQPLVDYMKTVGKGKRNINSVSGSSCSRIRRIQDDDDKLLGGFKQGEWGQKTGERRRGGKKKNNPQHKKNPHQNVGR